MYICTVRYSLHLLHLSLSIKKYHIFLSIFFLETKLCHDTQMWFISFNRCILHIQSFQIIWYQHLALRLGRAYEVAILLYWYVTFSRLYLSYQKYLIYLECLIKHYGVSVNYRTIGGVIYLRFCIFEIFLFLMFTSHVK